MNLSWVDDWPERQKRLEAMWACDAVDRAALLFTVPEGPFPEIPIPETLEERWTNIDYRLAEMSRNENVYYAAELIPSFWPNMGPGCAASYFGAEPIFKPDTCWFSHIVEDWDSFEIKIDPDNRWWKLIKDMTAAAVAESKGRYFVSHTDIGDPTDILSHLRGPDRLCMDLLERPEAVVRARTAVTNLWFGLYDELYNIVNGSGYLEGSCGWMGIWHPGKTYPIQCDFSCMISPKMFDEYVLPALVEQGRRMDQVIYHLDGPGAIVHLDSLLATPEISGIQWIQGSGGGSILEWLPLLKKVQKAKRVLNCWAGSLQEARTLLEELSPRGLILYIPPLGSREEAEEVIKYARKVATDKV